MQVLVSDTSVLIDIERASLTAMLFQLPYEFVVPDLLYETELVHWMGEDLIAMGLRIEELDSNEISRATALKRRRAMLSTPDVFAICLAECRGWTLLTGDGALRSEAMTQKIPIHGVLWVFDELRRHAVCENEILHGGLTQLRDHPRCRLPMREINIRMAEYEG